MSEQESPRGQHLGSEGCVNDRLRSGGSSGSFNRLAMCLGGNAQRCVATGRASCIIKDAKQKRRNSLLLPREDSRESGAGVKIKWKLP